jgi:hypothetical protein
MVVIRMRAENGKWVYQVDSVFTLPALGLQDWNARADGDICCAQIWILSRELMPWESVETTSRGSSTQGFQPTRNQVEDLPITTLGQMKTSAAYKSGYYLVSLYRGRVLKPRLAGARLRGFNLREIRLRICRSQRTNDKHTMSWCFRAVK